MGRMRAESGRPRSCRAPLLVARYVYMTRDVTDVREGELALKRGEMVRILHDDSDEWCVLAAPRRAGRFRVLHRRGSLWALLIVSRRPAAARETELALPRVQVDRAD